MSVRQSQRAALRQMLNFNTSISSSSKSLSFSWKILVYDDPCRDIISPLLNLQQLRDQGVTLHLSLKAPRESIADVPAVYFCEPTKENILQIAQDVCQGRYKAFYLNFSRRIPRPLLELLAKTTQKEGCAHKIAKVFDQFQSFVSFEDQLFSLELERTFVRYNHPDATEAEMHALMGDVVEGLFAALASMQNIPVLRAPKGGAAQMVAQMLNSRIRTNLESDNSVFSRSVLEEDSSVFGAGTRPVVIVLDRNFDLASGLRHGNTYQALAHDMLEYNSNRVTIAEKDGKKTAYILDVDGDDFWAKNASRLFQEVIQASTEQLEVVTSKQKALQNRGDKVGNEELFDNVKALPEVTKLKKQIKQHTDILSAAMEEIMKRDVPKFTDMEDAVCSNPDVLPQGLRDLLRVPADPADLAGQVEDRLRLLGVTALESRASEFDQLLDDVEKEMLEALLPSPASPAAAAAEPEAAAAEAAASASADSAAPKETRESALAKCVFAYLRQQRSVVKMRKQMSGGAAVAEGSDKKGTPSKTFQNAFGFVKGLGNSVIKGVKKMHQSYLPESTSPLRTTQAVRAICEAKVSLSEQFVSFDPKRGEGALPDGPGAKPHHAVVVFVVGSGNVREYQELLAWAKESEVQRRLVYGCTTLLRPKQFLQQIAVLGGLSLKGRKT